MVDRAEEQRSRPERSARRRRVEAKSPTWTPAPRRGCLRIYRPILRQLDIRPPLRAHAIRHEHTLTSITVCLGVSPRWMMSGRGFGVWDAGGATWRRREVR